MLVIVGKNYVGSMIRGILMLATVEKNRAEVAGRIVDGVRSWLLLMLVLMLKMASSRNTFSTFY